MTLSHSAQHVPSANIQDGDRSIVVEATPLAKSRRTRLGVVIDQPRINALRVKSGSALSAALKATLGSAVVCLLLVSVLYSVSLLLTPEHAGDAESWLPVGGLAVATCLVTPALLLLIARKPRAEFVRETKRFRSVGTDRMPGAGARILALQLLPGRVDEDLRSPGPSLQINLILDDRAQPRVGFITFRDVDWTREAGRKLADHLGVPLLDQLPESCDDQTSVSES